MAYGFGATFGGFAGVIGALLLLEAVDRVARRRAWRWRP